jgi:hypothetical protein
MEKLSNVWISLLEARSVASENSNAFTNNKASEVEIVTKEMTIMVR